jgi:hypothetical protein
MLTTYYAVNKRYNSLNNTCAWAYFVVILSFRKTMKDPQEEMPAVEETTSVEEVSPETEVTPEQHKLYQKLKGYYPDKEFASDSEAMDAADEKLSEHDSYREETEALLQNISDAVDADPEYAQLTAYIGKGMSFREAIARLIDPEDLQAYEGDPDYEALTTAKAERNSQREAHKARIAEVEANTQESAIKVQQFSDDNNLTEERTIGLLNSVEKVVTDINNGIISPDFLARMLTAETHEEEVADAVENALIEGKNTAIEEKVATEQSGMGDNIPNIASASVDVAPPAPKKSNEIDDLVGLSQKRNKF